MSPESKKEAVDKKIFKNHKKERKQSRKSDSCIVLPDIQGAYLSASATVEAALVIPIFIYAVMAVMYIMQMILVQVKVQESLYNTARKAAKYAYFYDCIDKGINSSSDISRTEEQNMQLFDKGISTAVLQIMFIQEIGAEYAQKAGIAGGNAGYIMLGSQAVQGTKEIILEVSYILKNPFDIFGIAVKKFTQRAAVTAWLGDSQCRGVESDNSISEYADKEYVYIAASGTVYHTDRNCTYISPSIYNIGYGELSAKRNENGGRYYECDYCTRKMEAAGRVYITAYGTKWHVTDTCPKINRSVMKVLKSYAAGMRKCSKCKG